VFHENTFDFILFSFNGIDYINNDERCDVLNHIKRILKPTGYYLFSSHNLQFVTYHYKNLKILQFFNSAKKGFLRIICFLKRLYKYFKKLFGKKSLPVKANLQRAILNSLTIKNYLKFWRLNINVNKEELSLASYKILNDGTYDTYYIKPSEQIKHLEKLFNEVKVFSLFNGSEIIDIKKLNNNFEPWLYYLCKK